MLKPLFLFFRYGGIHVFDFLQNEMGPGGRHTGYALDGAVDALQLIGGGAGYLQHKVIISGQIVAVQDIRVIHDHLGCSRLISIRAVTSFPRALASTLTV